MTSRRANSRIGSYGLANLATDGTKFMKKMSLDGTMKRRYYLFVDILLILAKDYRIESK